MVLWLRMKVYLLKGLKVIRITSDTIGYKTVKGERRRYKLPSIQGGKCYFGLYLLFRNEDGAPLGNLRY